MKFLVFCRPPDIHTLLELGHFDTWLLYYVTGQYRKPFITKPQFPVFASTSFLFFCLFQNYFAYATCFKPVSCSLIYIFGRVIYTACAYAHLDVNDNLEQYITALLTGVIAPLHAE